MKENIEEDLKKTENLIECFRKAEIVNLECKESMYQRCNYSHYKAIEHILSDYKRVLKENEELLREKIDNKKIIALAQNEFLGYEQGYQDGKVGRRSATQAIIEGQQYYIIQEQFERYKNQIEKLQKENEELKKFITEGITIEPNSPYKNYRLDFLRENFIPIQKIQDKIEELNKKEKQELKGTKGQDRYSIKQQYMYQRNILQDLLEEKGE